MNNETRDSGVRKNALIKSSMYVGTIQQRAVRDCERKAAIALIH